MKKETSELYMYKALYFKEKQKLNSILYQLEKYSYLLPDEYKHIIKEILKKEKGIVYHD